jgi:putative transposase
MVGPTQRVAAVRWAISQSGVSERAACRALGWSRSTHRRRSRVRRAPASADERRLRALARIYPRWGCPLLHQRLRLEGFGLNHKRTERLYREMDLAMRVRHRRRLTRASHPLQAAAAPNVCWSLDFMTDVLTSTRGYRWLNVLDDFSREGLCVQAQLSFPATRVVRVLDERIDTHGRPAQIRSDNGPEFIAAVTQQWADARGIEWKFIRPGKPAENAYIERFNGTFRTEVLDQHAFTDLEESQRIADEWLVTYNQQRPHQALGYLPPTLYRTKWQANQSLL